MLHDGLSIFIISTLSRRQGHGDKQTWGSLIMIQRRDANHVPLIFLFGSIIGV